MELEKELAEGLKSCCFKEGRHFKERKEKLAESASFLHRLGLLYLKKSGDGAYNQVKLNIIQSAALLNAAVVRQPESGEFKASVEKCCSHLLKVAGDKFLTKSLVALAHDASKMVKEMRSLEYVLNTEENALESDREKLMCDLQFNISDEEAAKLEETEIENVENLQRKISQKYNEIMDFIATKCEEIMGFPSCPYAVTGMGSLARREITPYSDFEHIIVLEDGVEKREDYAEIQEYFQWFSVIFQVIVINLGETIIPAVAVPCLNNFTVSGGDWFFDSFTPRGVSFDGFLPQACKLPLGRIYMTANDQTAELIQPVNKMLEYLNPTSKDKTDFSLEDILTKTCFVSGNKQIYDEFANKVKKQLQVKYTQRHNSLMKQIDEDLQKFDVVNNLLDLFGACRANIKRILYRSLTLFISALGSMHSIEKHSSFDIVHTLKSMGNINAQTAHRLLYATAVACQVRIKVYKSSSCQNDFVKSNGTYYHLLDSNMPNRLSAIVGERRLVDYFVIASDLQQAIKHPDVMLKLDEYLKPRLTTKFKVMRYVNLYHQLLYTWTKVQQENIRLPLEEEMWIRFYIAGTHRRNKEYKKALEELAWFNDDTFDYPVAPLSLTQSPRYPVNDASLKANLMLTRIKCLYHTRQRDLTMVSSKKAILYLETASLVPSEKYDLLCHALCYLGICTSDFKYEYLKAVEIFKEELSHLHKETIVSKLPRKATCLYNISECLMNAGKYQDAETAAAEAMKALRENQGMGRMIGLCCHVLGVCQKKKGRLHEALEQFHEELKIELENVPAGNHTTDSKIIEIRRLIKDIEEELNDNSES